MFLKTLTWDPPAPSPSMTTLERESILEKYAKETLFYVKEFLLLKIVSKWEKRTSFLKVDLYHLMTINLWKSSKRFTWAKTQSMTPKPTILEKSLVLEAGHRNSSNRDQVAKLLWEEEERTRPRKIFSKTINLSISLLLLTMMTNSKKEFKKSKKSSMERKTQSLKSY